MTLRTWALAQKQEHDSVQQREAQTFPKDQKREDINIKTKEDIAKSRCGRIRKSSQKGGIVTLSKRQMRHVRAQESKKKKEVWRCTEKKIIGQASRKAVRRRNAN